MASEIGTRILFCGRSGRGSQAQLAAAGGAERLQQIQHSLALLGSREPRPGGDKPPRAGMLVGVGLAEKIAGRASENDGETLKPFGADARRAVFVFMQLNPGHADRIGDGALGEAHCAAPHAQRAPDVGVDVGIARHARH